MQKKTKIALAAGVAGVLALGGLAGVASADGNWGKRHGMGHDGGMRMHMMERYDANKDGKLSQEEIDANRTQWHGDFDADKNGTLSLDEFQALWLKARHEQMVREFQRFDRDGNAQVTLDEYKDPLASMVADHDRNGDGVISRDDHRGMKGKHGKGKRGDRMRQGMGQGGGMGQGMMDQPADDAQDDQQ